MERFAPLLDRLVYTPARTDKLRLIETYFRATPDPDRGYALAALTGDLAFALPVRSTLADLVAKHCEPELYQLSRDYVGDTAETVALLWPEPMRPTTPPRLSEIVDVLSGLQRAELAAQLEQWLDRLDARGRWALLKLLTGALRVGVSARLARTAAAQFGGVSVADIEEVWHALEAPYLSLFAWLEGDAERPDVGTGPVFRPMMLAHPVEDRDLDDLDPAQLAIEWKWDGIRVQLVSNGREQRLYSRTGDDISGSFPDLRDLVATPVVLDGELLVVRDGAVAPFSDLQKRLNRRSVGTRLLRDSPAHIRLYDALVLDDVDIRGLSLIERRRRLEDWHRTTAPQRTDLSPLIRVADRAALRALWEGARGAEIEGLMLKRLSSPYLAGRPKGHWYKWKRAALTADCVLLYAQPGSGKRSSLYSDLTFGAWDSDIEPKLGGEAATAPSERRLVTVGKAYSGFTDEELARLDRWVRANTVERYGPVRAVRPTLVLEIAFDGVQASGRHKSGLALRFPRIARIRWDKPAEDADTVAALRRAIAA